MPLVLLTAHLVTPITPLQFADASEDIYWHSNGMEWEMNDTHIVFPGSRRPPIPMKRLYFLAGVIPNMEDKITRVQ